LGLRSPEKFVLSLPYIRSVGIMNRKIFFLSEPITTYFGIFRMQKNNNQPSCMSTAVTHVDDKVGRDPFRSPRHSCFVVAAFLRPRKLVIRRDAGSAAFQLRRRWFFLRPRRWCFVGTAFWAVRHCFVLPQHHPLSSRLFLRSRDIGDSSPRPQARDCFVLPRPFLGHATSSFIVAAFFCCRKTLGFLCGLLGLRDIVCAAAVLFWGGAARHCLRCRGPFLWCASILRRRGFFAARDIGVSSVRPLGAARHCLRCRGPLDCRDCIIPQRTLRIDP